VTQFNTVVRWANIGLWNIRILL